MAEILISIPYWRSADTIRRAVDSVLSQSFADFALVVLNDGDTVSPPWPALADITDRRLIRHDLDANRGRYFADTVAVAAWPDRWWMPVDADDWIEPHRLAALLDASGGADMVVSPWTNHRGDEAAVRAVRPPGSAPGIRATAHLSSLWRTAHARRWCHPGQRVAWDQIQTTAAWVFGTVTTVDDPSYHRQQHPGSLVTSVAYGKGTRYRRQIRRQQRRLWQAMRATGTQAGAVEVLRRDIPPALARQVRREARTLREVL